MTQAMPTFAPRTIWNGSGIVVHEGWARTQEPSRAGVVVVVLGECWAIPCTQLEAEVLNFRLSQAECLTCPTCALIWLDCMKLTVGEGHTGK